MTDGATETPDLGDYKSYVTIKETTRGYSEKRYHVRWRGKEAEGKTVPEALQNLAEEIEE